MPLPFLEPRCDIDFHMQMRLVKTYREYLRDILHSTSGRDLSLQGTQEIDLTRVELFHSQLIRAGQS